MTAFGYDPDVVPARQHRPSVLLLVRDGRHPRHDALPRARPRVALQLHARDRPRPLRARRQPVARAHAARRRAARRACTRARAGCGRTSSAARCRSAAGSTRNSSDFPDALGRLTRRAVPPRDEQGAAVVHPRRRRRAHLRPAHHPALRARAGADRRPFSTADLPEAWNTRFEEYLGIPVPDDRLACSRTCTGRGPLRLLPDVPARQRDERADLGGGARRCRTSRTTSRRATSPSSATGCARTSMRSAASSRRRRRSSASRAVRSIRSRTCATCARSTRPVGA